MGKPSAVPVAQDPRCTHVFFMGFQPWGEEAATDRLENAPEEWFEKERCLPWYHRTNYLVYEGWG